jgi:hypothetical protein
VFACRILSVCWLSKQLSGAICVSLHIACIAFNMILAVLRHTCIVKQVTLNDTPRIRDGTNSRLLPHLSTVVYVLSSG